MAEKNIGNLLIDTIVNVETTQNEKVSGRIQKIDSSYEKLGLNSKRSTVAEKNIGNLLIDTIVNVETTQNEKVSGRIQKIDSSYEKLGLYTQLQKRLIEELNKLPKKGSASLSEECCKIVDLIQQKFPSAMSPKHEYTKKELEELQFFLASQCEKIPQETRIEEHRISQDLSTILTISRLVSEMLKMLNHFHQIMANNIHVSR